MKTSFSSGLYSARNIAVGLAFLGAIYLRNAPRNASPIAIFLAEYKPELNDVFIASGPSKKDGFKIAINGPTNIGQINKKRQNENNPENSIFLFESSIVFMD